MRSPPWNLAPAQGRLKGAPWLPRRGLCHWLPFPLAEGCSWKRGLPCTSDHSHTRTGSFPGTGVIGEALGEDALEAGPLCEATEAHVGVSPMTMAVAQLKGDAKQVWGRPPSLLVVS